MLKLLCAGSDRWIYSVIALLALPTLASATTWHVTFDPAEPEDRVGAIAAQAASGDSILIDPGTYYEHIPLEGKSLTFIGIGGAGVTILDGSRDLPGREGSIIYTLTGAAEDLTVEGLTLRGGTGTPWSGSFDEIGGGAIFWWEEGATWTARLLLIDCVFEDNSTGDPDENWAIGGGAVFAHHLDDSRLERCSFSNNASATAGGDIYLNGHTASVVECSFDIAHGSWHGGSSIELADGSLTILGCTFESDMILEDEGWLAIRADPVRIEILDSQFMDRGTPVATRMVLDYFGGGSPRQEVVISRNLFWNASAPDSGAAASMFIAMPNGAFEIGENTFVGCGVDIQNTAVGPEIVFERNIVARGEAKFFIPAGGSVECCDFWRTTFVDYIGSLTLSDNISADPLFCDEEAGDLRIAFQSPCAAENSPAGCERMGALDPDCDLTPARRMSWGNIKALFRGER